MRTISPRHVLPLLPAAAIVTLLAACSSDSTTGTAALVAPVSVSVTSTPTSATVKWKSVTGATGYILQRATGAAGGVFGQLGGTLTDTTFTDNTVVSGTAYRYRVAGSRATELGPYSAEAPVTVGVAGPKIATLTGDMTTSRTLYSDTLYTLSGFVKVKNGATLTVQAGTVVVGDTLVLGSSLWITRGAKISAIGTATDPIVFTSARSAGNRKPGDWGGIIIVGNGIINRTGATILTEGSAAGQAENYAGGTDNNDNSGTIKYVRIEFAGYDISNGGGQELNTLSSYAVGRGTTYEYIEAMSGLDDSFEWWGGAVDGRYLISYESGDDHYDWTEGFAGRNQFLIALQTQKLTPRAGAGTFSSDPRGFEGDGCDPAVSGCVVTATATSAPYSMPVFANFSMVGTGQLAGFPTDGNGAVLRRGTGGTFRNGILMRWKGIGINVRDAFTDSLRKVDSLSIRGLVLGENGSNFNALGGLSDSTAFLTNNLRYVPAAADVFTSLNPAGLDWTLRATITGGGANPALTGGETAPAARVAGYFGGTWVNTTYLGAVDPAAVGTLWYQGWTRYVIN
jgi:hypothetical protein